MRRRLLLAPVFIAGIIASLLIGSGNAAVSPTNWDAVYDSAACGSVIDLAGGTYAAQTLTGSRCAGNPITFRVAGAVNVGTLTVNASNVTLVGIKITGTRLSVEQASNVVFDRGSGQSFDILDNTNNVTVSNSDFGNVTNRQPQISKGDFGLPDSARPTNIYILNNSLHDYRISDPSVHNECLQVLHGNGVFIRGNRIFNCAGTGNLGLTCESGTNNVQVENNFVYGVPNLGPNYGAQISGDCGNLLIRNNSSTLDWFFADGVTGKGYRIVGNYLPYAGGGLCSNGAVASHNVFRGGTCNSSDLNVSALQFVSSTDLHLASGANAIDKGDPASFPATDIDGEARSGAPDAGADEAGGTPPPPPVTTTTATTTAATTTVPPTTTAPTTTAPTTSTTTTTVSSCDAACEQAYKDQITALKSQLADVQAKLDAANANVAALGAQIAALQAKIDAALAALK